MMFKTLYDFCFQYGFDQTYWIAFSGGLDSHVLLDLCSRMRTVAPINLRVVHIHHGLNKNADAWAKHCEQICQQYNLEIDIHQIEVSKNKGESIEESAREKRYAKIQKCLNANDILLTAHHQDDQAETVLLQLVRGAGPKGLAAMPRMKQFGHGFHGRPLLSFTRKKLEQYAREQQLFYIDDESNSNTQLTRNFMRHHVLPLLNEKLFVSAAIARAAMHCAEANNLLEEFALDFLESVKGSKANTLSVQKLLKLNVEKQKLLLRTWIQKQGHLLPSAKKLTTIQKSILVAAVDRQPCVRFGNTEIRRFRDDLYLLPTVPKHDASKIYSWDLQQPLMIPNIGQLRAMEKKGIGICKTIERVNVCFRRGGEIANLPLRGRHTLKNLFLEWNIPTWERDQIPLIFVGEKLISVVGYFIDPDFATKDFAMGYELEFKKIC